jgi:phosphocarrier protein FPr
LISIVLVSHSARLAAGVVELASQMAGRDLRMGVAAGLDQPENPLGTDAAAVARAIDEVWSEDGVLVLMDSAAPSFGRARARPARRSGADGTADRGAVAEGAVAAAVAAGSASCWRRSPKRRAALAAKAAHLAGGTDTAHEPVLENGLRQPEWHARG